MSWNFDFFFFHSLCNNFKPQAILWGFHCQELEILAQGLAHISSKFDLFFHTLWLNFKPQVDLWRSSCQKPEILAQGLGRMSWNFYFYFSFILIELQTTSWFMKVSLPRVSNLNPRFGSHELKFWCFFCFLCDWTFESQAVLWRFHYRELEIGAQGLARMSWNIDFIFSIPFDWTSNRKLFYKGLVAESLKFKPMAWLTWAKILITFFYFYVIELQTARCFIKVSLPRVCNLSRRLGLYELKFIILFSIIWLNFKAQAAFWRSRCQELEIWSHGLAYMSWSLNFFFQSCDWTSNLKLLL